MILTIINKALEKVNVCLNNILAHMDDLKVTEVKEFIIQLSYLHWAEVYLWKAFEMPEDMIFFQSKDSDTWKLLN
jgi:hypothetical protein